MDRISGKKEQRSIKDKRRSEKLKGNRDVVEKTTPKPKTPKTPAQKKHEQEMRKQQVERGQFGLPGAGRGTTQPSKKQKEKSRKVKHKLVEANISSLKQLAKQLEYALKQSHSRGVAGAAIFPQEAVNEWLREEWKEMPRHLSSLGKFNFFADHIWRAASITELVLAHGAWSAKTERPEKYSGGGLNNGDLFDGFEGALKAIVALGKKRRGLIQATADDVLARVASIRSVLQGLTRKKSLRIDAQIRKLAEDVAALFYIKGQILRDKAHRREETWDTLLGPKQATSTLTKAALSSAVSPMSTLTKAALSSAVSPMSTLTKAALKLAKTNPEFRQALKDELHRKATKRRLTVGKASAVYLRTWKGGDPLNETMLWKVSVPGAEPHFVTSSRLFDPAETLVFKADENGRGSSGREVAGGPGIGHQEAIEDYLNVANMRSRKATSSLPPRNPKTNKPFSPEAKKLFLRLKAEKGGVSDDDPAIVSAGTELVDAGVAAISGGGDRIVLEKATTPKTSSNWWDSGKQDWELTIEGEKVEVQGKTLAEIKKDPRYSKSKAVFVKGPAYGHWTHVPKKPEKKAGTTRQAGLQGDLRNARNLQMSVNPKHVLAFLSLRKGDKVLVNTSKLRKPRVLTVEAKPERQTSGVPNAPGTIYVYVSSGSVRPGHRGGGTLSYKPEWTTESGKVIPEQLLYQPTIQQNVQDVTDLQKVSEASAKRTLMGTKSPSADAKLKQASRSRIGPHGLEAPDKGITLQPNTIYWMGASSTPSMVIVTKVTDDSIEYMDPYSKKKSSVQRWIGEDLIIQGSKRWLASYGKYQPELAKSISSMLRGGKGKTEKLSDWERVRITVRAKDPTQDLWRAAEAYGNVGGITGKDDVMLYQIEGFRNEVEAVKKDPRFTVESEKKIAGQTRTANASIRLSQSVSAFLLNPNNDLHATVKDILRETFKREGKGIYLSESDLRGWAHDVIRDLDNAIPRQIYSRVMNSTLTDLRNVIGAREEMGVTFKGAHKK